MAPANERGSSKLSLLAEAADEYIKLECNRRRHKLTLRKRLSFVDQFSVYAPKSRLKERQVQTKHHEFLLLPENKAALDAIVDHVRDLAELPPNGRQAISLSPMEQNQLQTWADDVHKLLYEFTPSSSHHRDPIVTILEKLQFLQDGHMCLVEVEADARTLLERWSRSGVFDSSSSDEEGGVDEDDDEDGADDRRSRRAQGPEQTYAYQTVRQRAAANVIKRNVMLWARSQQAFCDRVEELRLFGKTTQSLMEELTSRKRSPSTPTNDIFAMVKVRRDNLYSQSINFKDLMLYSKHVALFPVDQALRSVEELARKRFLFETRCAIKLQTVWRKTKKILQSKRMFKMVQELKLKHEQEEQARQQHLLEGKAKKASEAAMGKHKAAKSPKKGGRNSLVSPPTASSSSSPTKPSSKGSERGSEQHPGSTPPSPHGRLRSPGAALSRDEARSRHGFTPTDRRDDSAAHDERSTSSRKHRSADGTEKGSDDDGDTRDVEQAWQSFLDSATTAEVDISEDSEALMMQPSALNEPQDEGTAVATLSQAIDDDWRNWSDGEEGGYIDSDAESDADGQRKRKKTATPKSRSKPRSRASTSGAVNEGRLVTPRLVTPRGVEKSSTPDSSSDNEEHSPRHTSSRRGVRRIGDLLKPSTPADANSPMVVTRGGVPFKSSQPKVSKMVPFADFGNAEEPKKMPIQVVRAPARKHLYDLDSTKKLMYDLDSERTNKVALLKLFSPLVEDSDIQPEEISAQHMVSPEQARSMRTNTVTKAVKMERLKAAIMQQQEEKLYRYPDKKQEAANETQASPADSTAKDGQTGNTAQMGAYETTSTPHLYAGIAIHRGVIMRSKGRAEAALVASKPNETTTSASSARVQSASPPKKLKFGNHTELLRSIGIATAPSKAPQPPRRTQSSLQQEQHRRSAQKVYRRDTSDMKSASQANDDTRNEARAPNTVLPVLSGYRREKGRTFIKQAQPGTEMEPQTLLPSVLRKISNQTPVPVQQRRCTRRSIRRPLIQPGSDAVDEPALSTAATVASLDVGHHDDVLVDDDDAISEASEWSEQPESDSSGVSDLEEVGSEGELTTRRASKRRSMHSVEEKITDEAGEQHVRNSSTPRTNHCSGAPIASESATRLSRKLRHRQKRHSPSSSPTVRASSSSDNDLTGTFSQPEPTPSSQEAVLHGPSPSSHQDRSSHRPHPQADSRAPAPNAQSPAAHRASSVISQKNQAAFHRLLRQYLGLLQCDASVPISCAVPNTLS